MTQTLIKTGIDREAALKLEEVVIRFSDPYQNFCYEQVIKAIHQAGFATLLFPKRSSPTSKKMTYYWAMIDRNENSEKHGRFLLGANKGKKTVPFYFYQEIWPLSDYATSLETMMLDRPRFCTNVGGLRYLLAQQKQWSNKMGRGFRASEDSQFWREAFDERWCEGTDLVLHPEETFSMSCLRFNESNYIYDPSEDSSDNWL